MSLLEVNHVSVRYLTGDFKDIGLKEYVMRKLKNDYHVHEFWADWDISFTLDRGDMLGIIGTNGAGKSTILKVVAGIMEPSAGYVKREGSVVALLELASGFDGELTVRENTYLRGAMLGFTREFMDRTYDEIISFAELEEFQDHPFRQLSSGMKSRLAFSIASLVKPEILILDEVLSVGDGAFRKKSEAKMRQIIADGAATILVSHSTNQVRELCSKVLWLEEGKQIALGDTKLICALYEYFLTNKLSPKEASAMWRSLQKREDEFQKITDAALDEILADVLEQVRGELSETTTDPGEKTQRKQEISQPREKPLTLKQRIRKNLSMWIPIAAFFCFSILFYGPLGVFLSNAEDLGLGLSVILKITGIVSLATFIMLSAVGALLPSALSDFFARLLFGLALALYLQGNFININYGVLDGSPIQWERYTVYAILDTLIIFILIILPFVIGRMKKLRKNGFDKKVLVLLSIFFIFIQLPAMVIQLINYKPIGNQQLFVTNESLFELSSEKNVLVFVVDSFDDAYFNEFMEENPGFEEKLQGFVHYENTLSTGERTVLCVPPILSGKPFFRESADSNSYPEYIDSIWEKENLYSKMAALGVDVRIFTEKKFLSANACGYISNVKAEGEEISQTILAKKLYKLTGYIFSPHIAKRFFWLATGEFDEAKTALDSYSSGDNVKFIKDFNATHFTTSDAYQQAFRFYHIFGTHAPYTLGADGKYSETATRSTTATGVMRFLAAAFDELKQKGLYDDATIIIMADHGYTEKNQNPVFLLKQAGDSEGYSVNSIPLSMFDFSNYLADIFRIPFDNQPYGMHLSELTEGMVRDRRYFYSSNRSSAFLTAEYQTFSHAKDPDGLILLEAPVFDEQFNAEPYRLGTELSFAIEDTGGQYSVDGFGGNDGDRTFIVGNHAMLKIPFESLPDKDTVEVTMGFWSSDWMEPTQVIFTANNAIKHEGSSKEKYGYWTVAFEVSVDDIRQSDNTLTIALDFPKITDEDIIPMSIEKMIIQ